MRLAVTGAGGFIGRELCGLLRQRGHDVVAVPRGDVRAALRGAQAVIHLAGRAHVLRETAADPLTEFRRINVGGTLEVARAALHASVPRFVFVSSIGALGASSGASRFTEMTVPAPTEPYAVSKLEAEISLRHLERETGLDVVIVRPPLVYGPFVKGNFLRLLRLTQSGVPLPLGAIKNERSFVGVTNLADFLMACATQPRAAGGLFLICDGEDISIANLVRALAATVGKSPRIFSCPTSLLDLCTRILGRHEQFARMVGSLRVDSGLARRVLGWRPPKTLAAGLFEMAEWYRREQER